MKPTRRLPLTNWMNSSCKRSRIPQTAHTEGTPGCLGDLDPLLSGAVRFSDANTSVGESLILILLLGIAHSMPTLVLFLLGGIRVLFVLQPEAEPINIALL